MDACPKKMDVFRNHFHWLWWYPISLNKTAKSNLMKEDIRLQLPDEAKRFERIDKTFKKIMNDTAKNTLVLEVHITSLLDVIMC